MSELEDCWVGYRQRDMNGRTIGVKRMDEKTIRMCECGKSYIQTISAQKWVTIGADHLVVIRPENPYVEACKAFADMGAKGQLDVDSLVRFLIEAKG